MTDRPWAAALRWGPWRRGWPGRRRRTWTPRGRQRRGRWWARATPPPGRPLPGLRTRVATAGMRGGRGQPGGRRLPLAPRSRRARWRWRWRWRSCRRGGRRRGRLWGRIPGCRSGRRGGRSGEWRWAGGRRGRRGRPIRGQRRPEIEGEGRESLAMRWRCGCVYAEAGGKGQGVSGSTRGLQGRHSSLTFQCAYSARPTEVNGSRSCCCKNDAWL